MQDFVWANSIVFAPHMMEANSNGRLSISGVLDVPMMYL